MSALLVITNEKAEIIYKKELVEDPSPLPLLLAYASLETDYLTHYNQYNVYKYICLPGHLIILVTDDAKFPLKEFFSKAEAALSEELMNPMVDDEVWLSKDFADKINSWSQQKGNTAQK